MYAINLTKIVFIMNVNISTRLTTSWKVRGSNPGGRFLAPAHFVLGGPPSLLYCVYRIYFPRLKRPGRVFDHPPSFSADIKRKSRAIRLLPNWAFRACDRASFAYCGLALTQTNFIAFQSPVRLLPFICVQDRLVSVINNGFIIKYTCMLVLS